MYRLPFVEYVAAVVWATALGMTLPLDNVYVVVFLVLSTTAIILTVRIMRARRFVRSRGRAMSQRTPTPQARQAPLAPNRQQSGPAPQEPSAAPPPQGSAGPPAGPPS